MVKSLRDIIPVLICNDFPVGEYLLFELSMSIVKCALVESNLPEEFCDSAFPRKDNISLLNTRILSKNKTGNKPRYNLSIVAVVFNLKAKKPVCLTSSKIN